MKDTAFQMEFWIPGKRGKGGTWKLATTCHPDHGRTWRKVKVGHSHKDKMPHSIARVRDGHARDRFEQCQHYCAYATRAGLRTVTIFAGDGHGLRAALEAGLHYVEVDPAEFLGDAPTAETDPE